MHSTSFVYKTMSYKYNLNVFRFGYGLLVVFVCLDGIEANSVPIGSRHPLIIVAYHISFTNFKSEYYNYPIK